ncbi:DUF926-domain-containing protein [Trametopsis cervina]|nr:DUF926-domain-containing protein [Trametopsis cervina]
MATIHPSRLGLVPQDSNRQRGRSPSPRLSRPHEPSSPRSPAGGRSKYNDGNDDRRRDERDGDRAKHRARADDYFEGDRKDRAKERSRSIDRQRDREREDRHLNDRVRRPSPEYSEYRRPSPPHLRREDPAVAAPPWKQQENMYPSRRGGPPMNGYGGGGSDFMDGRRQQREQSTVSIWPPSPKAPARSSLSPDGRRHKKSKKRRRDSSVSSATDSEDERRRRERKERKKSKKEKERHVDKEYRRRKSRSRSERIVSDNDDHDTHQHRSRRRTRSRSVSKDRYRDKRSATRTKSPDERPPPSEDEDEWVEKPVKSGLLGASTQSTGAMAPPPVPTAAASSTTTAIGNPDEDEDDEVGPQPLPSMTSSNKKVDERQYGGALLRGEGSAMAAFLKDGTDVRIPRRGEIGLTSDEIATYEAVGYVMSGSRHRRMNAVRMRKENQVISAEEKRGILKLQQEERERREAILREEFQELVNEKLKSQGAGK